MAKKHFRPAKMPSQSDFPRCKGVIWSKKVVSDFHFVKAIFRIPKIAKIAMMYVCILFRKITHQCLCVFLIMNILQNELVCSSRYKPDIWL